MAAVANQELVTITINEIEIQVPKGELIVEAVKRLGLEIPIFCYHPRLKPVGMCRMCLVEVGFRQPDGSVRKMPKPQAGCTLPASEGMAIYTDTEMVHRDRKGVLEFLLVNHPLDCPICDRGGECPLQNNTIFYGPSTSRFTELKRHLPKAYPLSEYVTLDLERCIQCGRCVRFTEEISGDAQLAFRFRGAQMQPSTFQLLNFESKFSGNVIEICPVGALTSTKYRFRARPWDLETKPSICTECSNHCNVWFDTRSSKFVRMNGRTNEMVNEEWTCDKGKFGQDWYNSADRLGQVLIRSGSGFTPAGWSEAYDQILPAFKDAGKSAAILIGGKNSNEALFMLKKFGAEVVNTPNIDHRWAKTIPSESDSVESVFGTNAVQDSIADLEFKKSIIVFGTNLAEDLPMIYLRVRKAWFNHGAVVSFMGQSASEVESFAANKLRYKANSEAALALAVLKSAVDQHGYSVPAGVTSAISSRSLESLCKAAEVDPKVVGSIASSIVAGAAIITSSGIYDSVNAQDTVEALAGLAMISGATFNCYDTTPSGTAAGVIGLVPGKGGMNTNQILEACSEHRIKALWLVNCDPFELCENKRLVADALESVDFLVVQSATKNSALPYASIVLPASGPAEQEGTYTNCERRVQHAGAVLAAPGEAKAGWRIFSEVLLRANPGKPFFNSKEVFEALCKENSQFKSVNLDELSAEGSIVQGRVKYEVTNA
ncbi:MAG: NADH-quinone oxidoreductase subunit NuoG [Armatimonadetes bacterium]|nr:NADH-quinone oxidoreductase subunit NuoG [Armatimonadota bacterium]